MAKINISIDDDLLERLDRVAKSNYMSRSGLISTACAQFINANEVVVYVKEMALCMRKIADSGSVDEETLEKLDEFERISQLLISKK